MVERGRMDKWTGAETVCVDDIVYGIVEGMGWYHGR